MAKDSHSWGNLSGNVPTGHTVYLVTLTHTRTHARAHTHITHLYITPNIIGSILQRREHIYFSFCFPLYIFRRLSYSFMLSLLYSSFYLPPPQFSVPGDRSPSLPSDYTGTDQNSVTRSWFGHLTDKSTNEGCHIIKKSTSLWINLYYLTALRNNTATFIWEAQALRCWFCNLCS
jgi:hypothetical protein